MVILSFDVILHALKTWTDTHNFHKSSQTESSQDKEQTNAYRLLQMDVIAYLFCVVQVNSLNSILFEKNNCYEE